MLHPIHAGPRDQRNEPSGNPGWRHWTDCVCPGSVSDCTSKHGMDGFSIALSALEAEVMISDLPRAKVPRQKPPHTDGSDHINKTLQMRCRSAGRRHGCVVVAAHLLQYVRLFIIQISRIKNFASSHLDHHTLTNTVHSTQKMILRYVLIIVGSQKQLCI